MELLFVLVSFCVFVCRGFGHPTSGVDGIKIHTDPEVYMNTTQLITSQGYPCEEHDVHTDDGYILGVQRIPAGRNNQKLGDRPVVLLQHGLLSCSACWVENNVNGSLGFLLADAGYDVWLGNSRGNTYSLRHEKLSPDQNEFWDFSMDEMAKYDLPATVDKILAVTGAKQLFYVGHSQGTKIAFAALSYNQDLSSKIKLFAALAPAAYLGNLKSPIRLLSAIPTPMLYAIFGEKDFMPSSEILRWLGKEVCGRKIPAILCENVLFLLGGFDAKEMNETRIPVYVGQHPAGTSTHNMIHYAQAVISQNFQWMDFGSDKNMVKYNQTTPPQYDASKIQTPIAMYSGTNDWLTVPKDINRLVPELKTLVKHKVIQGWEHLDFIWAMNAPSACYADLMALIKQYV